MSNGIDERDKIDRLTEKLKVSANAKATGDSSMRCPRCQGQLIELTFEEVLIDRCEQCAGVWLDAGELEQLTRREESGWISRLWFSEG